MPTTKAVKTPIIGAVPAGYTASVDAARAGLDPVVIQGLQPGGQFTITTEVENWPGEVSIQGPDLTDRMARQAEHAGAKLVFDLDVSRRPFRVGTDGGVYLADTVVIATGAQAKWLGLDNGRAFVGVGVSGCAVCDGVFRNKDVVMAGGGNTAVEDALYLTHHASRVTLVQRRDHLRAEKILQGRLFKHPKVEAVLNRTVDEILGEGAPARVTEVRLRDTATGEVSTRGTDGVFVAIGHSPATEVFRGKVPMDREGHILARPDSTAIDISGLFLGFSILCLSEPPSVCIRTLWR